MIKIFFSIPHSLTLNNQIHISLKCFCGGAAADGGSQRIVSRSRCSVEVQRRFENLNGKMDFLRSSAMSGCEITLVVVHHCREALEVQWPPFIASRYTSNFLRDNAFYSSVEGLCSTYRLWMLECRWRKESIAVDTLSGPAKLSFVDVERVLSEMRERHPKQLVFLGTCVLEYSEGPFFSTHPIVRIDDQGLVLPGIFNNAARSSAITVDSLDELYESLQKFGRICAENTCEVQLMPGQRLFFNNARGMLGAPAQSGRNLVIKCLS
uniref:TauD/TfdA-like domain-containing protein n=1 Tax=Globodera rostochiensis TaxID=31243 RepID=A0A914GR29_GLORO